MSNYTKTTNFAAKDSLPSGNAAKIVKGTEIDTEFNNIATASATKADIAGPTFTGTVTIPTVDLNGGAIDGTTVGASTAAAITGTTIVANTSINIAGDGATVTGIKDEDDMSSDSATKLATQQSIKAYVDSQVTAQDLDVTDGSTSIDIDLDSESLGILGGTGIDSTASGTGVTLAIDSTVTTLTGTQTLTNKTLTSPTLNTPTIGTSFTIGSATITEAELEILDGATVTTAELNVLDGITSTTAELNILDGVTSTAAELNILDGVTSTAAELNILDGVTATTAELNYVDGVTSNVQTQLDAKAPIAGATFTGTTTIPTADINGGAIDGTVIGGSSAAAGNFTTLGASGAITGTLGTAAQTNITSVGTLGSLTVSGDVTVDTNTLKVDSSNNRVGILNASPDVSLDVGSATDAMHVPVGTTAQRPGSPAAGYFRYNSTTGGFEGYTDAWGAIAGGGGGVAPSIDTMTGDGSDTTLALTNAPVNENATFVTIDGVAQHKSTYSVSGTTLTFSTAPPTGAAVEAITLNTTTINTASILQDADGDTKVQVEESSDEDKIRFDTAGTERAVIDSSGLAVTGNIGIGGAAHASDALNITTTNQHIRLNNGSELGILALTSDGDLDLWAHGADEKINFRTGTGSGTVAMNVVGTNVGVGTSAPSRTFHSLGASGISTVGKFEAGGTQAYIQLSSNGQADGDSGYVGYDSSKNLTLFTDNTERMRIDSSGNLLVGGTTFDNGNFSGNANGINVFDATHPIVLVKETGSNNTFEMGLTSSAAFLATQDAIPMIFATSDAERARIDASGDLNIVNTGQASLNYTTDGSTDYARITGGKSGSGIGDLRFFTYSGGIAERMRIDSSGNVMVGKTAINFTTAGAELRSNGQINSGSTADFLNMFSTSASAYRFYVTNAGTIKATNTTISAISDQRFKENIRDLDDGLSKVMELRPRKFDWKEGKGADIKDDRGFIAQEFEKVFPDLISEWKDPAPEGEEPYKAVSQDLIPTLVKAIQEQQATIESQAAAITDLTTRLTALENN